MTAMKEAPPRAAAFRVLFSDGESEVDIGDVTVNPVLAFKKFQFAISEMIGVSPHQIALFLVRQRKVRGPGDARRKIPIDEGTDFGAMARERDCVVLAQLKRTRRDRRGRARRGHGGGAGYVLWELEKDHAQVPEKTILRRPTTKFFGGASPMAGVLPAVDNSQLMGMFNYAGQRTLQLQHERYLQSPAAMALYRYAGAGAKPLYDLDTLGRPDVEAMEAAVCGVCAASREEPPPLFHCCARDRIVAGGFRTRVGPIERPRKARLQHPA